MNNKSINKIIPFLCLIVVSIFLVSCSSEPKYSLSYEDSERVMLDNQFDCVAIYTEFNNESNETAVVADNVNIKAFQNGVEIPVLVPLG